MSDIASIGHVNGTPHFSSVPATSAAGRAEHAQVANGRAPERIVEEAVRSRDRIEISGHAMLLDRLRQLPEVRMERVEAVREAIASGSYETPERIEAAIEALIADLQD